MTLVVKNTFIHWGAGDEHPIHIFADTPTEAIPGQKRIRMVAEGAFEPGTHARAYVETYGILIGPENLREKPDTEIDSYGGWFLHKDANGAWAEGPHGGLLTAKRVDQLYDLIDEWENGEP
jgi:hypothetical protein